MNNYEKAVQTLDNAESWKQDLASELLKPAKKKFYRRRVYAENVDSIWAVDLLENKRYIKENKQYRYILVVVDVFSKMAWAKPMKKKNAQSAVSAFEEILNETGLRPSKIWADKGMCTRMCVHACTCTCVCVCVCVLFKHLFKIGSYTRFLT